MEIDPEF